LADYDRNEIEAKLKQRLEEIDRTRGTVEIRDQYQGEELADYDQHPGDQGTETLEQEMDATKAAILDQERSLVEQALERLADGSYGTCVDCGKEIPPARLQAMPEAIRCVDDQRRFESTHSGQTLPSDIP
jgi:RNA polymerase-binding transcription factor DksA